MVLRNQETKHHQVVIIFLLSLWMDKRVYFIPLKNVPTESLRCPLSVTRWNYYWTHSKIQMEVKEYLRNFICNGYNGLKYCINSLIIYFTLYWKFCLANISSWWLHLYYYMRAAGRILNNNVTKTKTLSDCFCHGLCLF